MKKSTLIALFLSLGMLLMIIPCTAENLVSAAVSDVSVAPGYPVNITISLDQNPGLAGWMFRLNWDPEALSLNPDTVKASLGFSSGVFLSREEEPGSMLVSWYCTEDVLQDGELFSLQLLTSDTAAGPYPIELSCIQENTLNTREQEVPIQVKAGTVTVLNHTVPNIPEQPEDSGDPIQPPYVDTPDSMPQPEVNKPPETLNPVPMEPSMTFSDVASGDYYYAPVRWAAGAGITNGTSPTTFSPGMSCTRAQAVTFLWRVAGSPVPQGTADLFTDVPVGSYYELAVLWAAENGITQGVAPREFAPNLTVTRAQMVTFVWRAAEAPPQRSENCFTDISESDYYMDAVCWALTRQITTGTSETTFSPDLECSRGQLVTFLYRAQK